LAAAFPDKSAADIERILRGVWDNYGRVGAEFAHLDRICELQSTGRPDASVFMDQATLGHFQRYRDDGKPALFFTAHLANWEVPAPAARAQGVDIAVPVRTQHLNLIAEAIARARPGGAAAYIPIDAAAPAKMKSAADRGACIAVMVDQHIADGIDVVFFGHSCKVTPMVARLARSLEWPIKGIRAIRLPDQRFRVEVTDPIEPARDANGRIDIAATMQTITAIVEGWVREHPEQWLWLHRRWR
jgi:KDO2-lipid IV(A) lauroyltransferase